MKAAFVSPLPRLQRFVSVAILVLASTLVVASTAVAQSPPYTLFSSLEAVNPDGSSSFSFPTNGSPSP